MQPRTKNDQTMNDTRNNEETYSTCQKGRKEDKTNSPFTMLGLR